LPSWVFNLADFFLSFENCFDRFRDHPTNASKDKHWKICPSVKKSCLLYEYNQQCLGQTLLFWEGEGLKLLSHACTSVFKRKGQVVILH